MGGHTRSVSPVNGSAGPPSRARGGGTQSHGGTGQDGEEEEVRPPKRRKTRHIDQVQGAPDHAFPDVVTKGIISEQEARDLFAM